MRSRLPAVTVLCAAALWGLTAARAFANDPVPDPTVPAAQPADAAKIEHSEPSAPARHDARAERDDSAGEGQPASRVRPPVFHRPLDLSAPPVSHVMTPEQVQALLDQPDDDQPEEVMVEEGRYESPVPRGQVRALAWALMHPLEAWRIFTPVTDQ